MDLISCVWKSNNWTDVVCCHLRMVPDVLPKLVMVEELYQVYDNDFESTLIFERGPLIAAIENVKTTALLKGFMYMNHAIGKDLRMRKRHVNELFPETRKMPFDIAKDFIREKISAMF